MVINNILFLVIIFCFITKTVFSQISKEEESAFSVLSKNKYKSHLQFLSDDLLEGRAPATRGDKIALKYIETQFRLNNLTGGATNSSFVQQVPIIGMTSDPKMELIANKNGKSERFKFREEFIGFSGLQENEVNFENAEIVFVGYGIDAPEQKWNDYKDVNVKGKVLLMMNNDPAGDDPKFFAGKGRTYYGRWTYKYEIAAKKGALGAIIIHTTESAGYPFQVVQTSWSRERFSLANSNEKPLLLKSWLTEDATKKLLQLSGHSLSQLVESAQSRSFKPVALGINASIVIKNSIRALSTGNVLGVVKGSDPILSEEYVLISAHHDHLGISSKPINGDSINNGAMDNASGVSMLLTLAEGFALLKNPTKRSLIFVSLAAEESGLLGSEFYAANPTIHPSKIVANVNMDGINMFGETRDVAMVGKGKSTIDKNVEETANIFGMKVKSDQYPELGFFYRSDQFNFAKIGIPPVYLDAGADFVGKPEGWGKQKAEEYTAKDYHQPSDEIKEEWNYDGTVQMSKFYFHLINQLANQKVNPVWNKGDEFERARLESFKK